MHPGCPVKKSDRGSCSVVLPNHIESLKHENKSLEDDTVVNYGWWIGMLFDPIGSLNCARRTFQQNPMHTEFKGASELDVWKWAGVETQKSICSHANRPNEFVQNLNSKCKHMSASIQFGSNCIGADMLKSTCLGSKDLHTFHSYGTKVCWFVAVESRCAFAMTRWYLHMTMWVSYR